MTFKEFQQQGYTATEAEVQKIEKLILSQYKEAGKKIDDKLKELYLKLQAEGIKPEDQYNWLIQYDRNIKLKKEIKDIYTFYDLKAKGLTVESGSIAMANNYYRQLYSLEWLDAGLSFSVINPDLIKYGVTGQMDAWKNLINKSKAKYGNSSIWPPSGTLTELFAKNRKDTILAIQRSINSGMMVGDSYTKISRAINKIIGTASKDTATGQLAKSLRIARTEGNRLLNEGGYANTLEAVSQGLDMVRQWDAALDLRTRAAHGSADGQQVEVTDSFIVDGESLMFPGDSAGSPSNVIHCRCTTLDIPRDYQPTVRRGRNPVTGKNEVFSYKNYDQWAKDNGLKANKYGQLI
jgi:hypothetical protein